MNFIFEIIKEDPAIVIAGCALLLTIWQGLQNRKHNKLSVKPLLEIDSYNSEVDGKGFYKVSLANCGIGPAVITDVKLFFNGEPFPYDEKREFRQFVWDRICDFDVRVLNAVAPEDGLVSGAEKVLLEFHYNYLNQSIDQVRKIGILIEYESFYGKKMPPCKIGNVSNTP